MPISGKKIAKLFFRLGYVLVKRQGKGSHMKLRNSEGITVIVPNHKELSRGVEKSLKKILESGN